MRSRWKRSPLLWALPLALAAIIVTVIAVNRETPTYPQADPKAEPRQADPKVTPRQADQKAAPVEGCKQIRLGMTRDKVLKMLPEPIGRISYKRHGREKERLIFPSREDAATPPQLVIDGKTGHVEEVVCDDTYRLIQK